MWSKQEQQQEQQMDSNKLIFEGSFVSTDNDFAMHSDIRNSFSLEYPMHCDREYIGVCLNGYAEIEVNLIEHTISKNEVVIISKNQIVFHHKISDDFRFILFSYSNEILNEFVNEIRKYPPFFVFFRQRFPSFMLNETEAEQIMDYYNLMWKATKNVQNDHKTDSIKHLLSSLLITLHWFANKNADKPAPTSRKHELVHEFFTLIFEHYKEAKDVSFYADKLCVSPKYLSTLVRRETDRTAKDCIDNYVILESRVLLNSSFTIQEISQQLNFPNQSFFGKYFKKHTGMSPMNYRKSR